jgi:hypothetical protein
MIYAVKQLEQRHKKKLTKDKKKQKRILKEKVRRRQGKENGKKHH